jgi:acyl carrier protein
MSTVTTEQVEARVVDALASFGPDKSQITRESTFEELDIDSLDLVELAQIVEDEYGVVLKGEDMKGLQTVGDAIDLITSRAS